MGCTEQKTVQPMEETANLGLFTGRIYENMEPRQINGPPQRLRRTVTETTVARQAHSGGLGAPRFRRPVRVFDRQRFCLWRSCGRRGDRCELYRDNSYVAQSVGGRLARRHGLYRWHFCLLDSDWPRPWPLYLCCRGTSDCGSRDHSLHDRPTKTGRGLSAMISSTIS